MRKDYGFARLVSHWATSLPETIRQVIDPYDQGLSSHEQYGELPTFEDEKGNYFSYGSRKIIPETDGNEGPEPDFGTLF
jgi:hypothetical protein